jgi:hypothetical protein
LPAKPPDIPDLTASAAGHAVAAEIIIGNSRDAIAFPAVNSASQRMKKAADPAAFLQL